MPAVSWIAHFREARWANRQVGSGEKGRLPLARARIDPERLAVMVRHGPGNGDVPKTGQGRSRGLELIQEPGDRISITFGFDQDSMLPIAHRPAEPMGYGESVDEWAEPDSLDNPFDHDAATGSVSRLRECDCRAHVTPFGRGTRHDSNGTMPRWTHGNKGLGRTSI